MDRFRWCSYQQIDKDYNEKLLIQCNGIRIYENSTKTSFERGLLKVTNCRFIWMDEKDPQGRCISLPLLAVNSVKLESPRGFYGSQKLAINLIKEESMNLTFQSLPTSPNWARNWLDPSLIKSTKIQNTSSEDVIKFSFTEGVKHKDVYSLIEEYIVKKEWCYSTGVILDTGLQSRTRVGIADIERSQAAKLNETDSSINKAFEDLENLMRSAQTMVKISRDLSLKLKENKEKGEDLDASIVELRSQLLSMGIKDDQNLTLDHEEPSKFDSFEAQLAKEISYISHKILLQKTHENEIGGCLDLASVYCRINRARGLDLVSPRDVYRACEVMEKLNLPVIMKKFPSGFVILQLASENEEKTLLATKDLVELNGHMNPAELSRNVKIAPSLAKERLNSAVNAGHLCVDESIQGTYYHPNKFLE